VIGRTLLWTGVGVGLVVLGYLLALASRRIGALWRYFWWVFVLPVGASALVAGATFRLIFDPTPERGMVTALTGAQDWLYEQRIWLVLILAFSWTWLGYVISLFRAGFEAIDRDPVKHAFVNDKSKPRTRWLRQLRLVRPVLLLVMITVVVAAARLFDLVLITAPGSMQYSTDVAGVYWWRLTGTAADRGEPASLAIALAAVLAVIACLLTWGMRQLEPSSSTSDGAPKPLDTETVEESRFRWKIPAAFVIAAFAVPAVVITATALHSPRQAAASVWWSPYGIGFESLRQVGNAGLWQSMWTTATVAFWTTILLLCAALPVAYVLAARASRATWLSRKLSWLSMFVLVVLAVMPVPAYLEPVRIWFTDHGFTGSRLPLVLVHAAAGLPFAILTLRAALIVGPNSPTADALFGLTTPQKTVERIWRRTGPAVVAVAVLEFVMVWNDFIISFLLSGPGTSPMSLVLWGEARQFAVSSGTVAASACVLSMVPVVLLLLTWRRFVVPGLTGEALR
jgi:alpha-glucoside transport system permease protein